MKRKAAARKPQHDAATACAKDVLARWLAEAAYASPEKINGGGCDAFCSDLEHEIRTRFPGINDIEGYYVASFLAVDQTTGDAMEGGPFDWGMLKKHWPGVAPPRGDDEGRLERAVGMAPVRSWHPYLPPGRGHVLRRGMRQRDAQLPETSVLSTGYGRLSGRTQGRSVAIKEGGLPRESSILHPIRNEGRFHGGKLRR